MNDKIAIICGAGDFPLASARAAQAAGKDVFLVGLRGAASDDIGEFPHIFAGLGEFGKIFRELAERGIGEMAFIGALGRPEFGDLRLDWGGVKRLPDIVRLLKGGDDHALKGVIAIFEKGGVRVVGVDAFAPDLLVPVGALTTKTPSAEELDGIRFARELLEALSPFDVGQAAVVAGRRVLAVEAAEGTDAMLARVAALRQNGRWKAKGRVGVLVKAPKTSQDLRVDLPAIGSSTVEAAEQAGLAGIALAAGRVLMLERERVAAQAQNAGLFLHGFAREA